MAFGPWRPTTSPPPPPEPPPPPPGRRVTDAQGAIYTLERRLGGGAQGQVFAVAGGRYAVKLLSDRSDAQRLRIQKQLRFLRAQADLLRKHDVAIAHPLELLNPPLLGYVMTLCADMSPLAALLPRSDSDPLPWYRDSGGLRRRLRLLARLAAELSKLHALGLAYGDLSPGNVLISTGPEFSAVFLIDSDNLLFEGQPGAPGYYTPDYGAPELVNASGAPSTLSDAFAFAVLVHRVLRLCHPLKGDEVEEGPPELEEQALRGELPWIDHPDDASNRCTRGLPDDLVFTRSLRELCQRSFGAGLRTPRARPSLAEWSERLTIAADLCLRCRRCGWTWLAVPKTACPACAAPRPAHALLQVLRFDPQAPEAEQHLLRPRGVPLPGYALEQDEPPVVVAGAEWQLIARGPGRFDLRVRARDDAPRRHRLFLSGVGADPLQLGARSLYVPLSPPPLFHLVEDLDGLQRPHRVLRLSLELEGAS